MTDKKRGFFGRLFGGKESASEEPHSSEHAETPDSQDGRLADAADAQLTAETEMVVEPVASELPPQPPIDAGLGPDLPPPPDYSAEQISTDVGDEAEKVVEHPDPESSATEPATAPAPPEPVAVEPASDEPKLSWFQKLKRGLSRSSSALTDGISSIFTKRKLDAGMLEELEDILIQADLGVDTAMAITDRLSDGRYNKEISPEEVRAILSEEVEKVLDPVAAPLDLDTGKKPHVVLMVGVNGTGKTTTIGKLSQKLANEGKTVMLAAGDTFRAAAVEQLKIWGQRTGADVIARDTGADAAGLAFDAMKEATDKGVDVLLIDTAGRLQNKAELMDELKKVIRVIKKHDPDAPHTCLLTLDATTGQNALSQVEIFGKVAGVTGLVMTKLDGTARGGILVAIAAKFGLPVHFIGVGEGVEDLEPFSAKDFASAIAGLA
ncbi:signal recognition particle-docking protein FtsY [Roseibium hamelinense]|uniref:Signal recognition particle receptor FtsY n=1 Tax=Roseibium hamelinense TaxID=150831 RepID=A0A562SN47_9HYPH|nr:signal recognition particle-docking protein FtsY [Roseibium hamelinense]MTI44071.1 signal recognition particle-docking protein FtsY [Roseibium hamelinense]TWI82721.1 signal recognition particle-docking protein FtsY [Roseibium hamelinense]